MHKWAVAVEAAWNFKQPDFLGASLLQIKSLLFPHWRPKWYVFMPLLGRKLQSEINGAVRELPLFYGPFENFFLRYNIIFSCALQNFLFIFCKCLYVFSAKCAFCSNSIITHVSAWTIHVLETRNDFYKWHFLKWRIQQMINVKGRPK